MSVTKGSALPKHELDVLQMAANGATLEQTGKRLYLNPQMVKDYRRNARIRLGARNTTHAVMLALRQGLIK